MDTYDLVNSQVFSPDDWLPFITALQTAQATNNGIVVSLTHTTVDNPKFGIIGGQTIKVLWIYNGRVINWESQMDAQMQDYLLPKDDPYNQAAYPKDGPFKMFPWYETKLDSIFAAQSNLLADLGGWLVYQHQDLFLDALGMTSDPTETDDPAENDDSSNSSSGGNGDNFVDSDAGVGTISAVALVVVMGVCFVLYRSFWSKDIISNSSLKESWLPRGSDVDVSKQGRGSTTELASSKNPMDKQNNV